MTHAPEDLESLERWDAITTPPHHPHGDVGVTVCHYERDDLVDKFEFSFYRDTDEAGDIYWSLPIQPDSTESDAAVINRAKFCAGVRAADETGARAFVGPFFSQRYLDSLPDRPREPSGDAGRSRGSDPKLADEQKARLLDAILDEAGIEIGEMIDELDG